MSFVFLPEAQARRRRDLIEIARAADTPVLLHRILDRYLVEHNLPLQPSTFKFGPWRWLQSESQSVIGQTVVM